MGHDNLLAALFVLKMAGLLRVSPEEESEGLDLSEHASSAYQSV